MDIPLGTYRRRFSVHGQEIETVSRATFKGLRTTLSVDGVVVAEDATANSGADALRNHSLAATLGDGSSLAVEAGYVGWWSVGIAARIDGQLVHESHPGRTIEFPKGLRGIVENPPSAEKQRANRVPIIVDVLLGLIFFVVASLTDLTTAALVGAGLGIALFIVQRFVTVDLLGGLAIFGTVMLVVSAGFALIFNDGIAVQLRTSVVGLVTTALFAIDAMRGGKWLGRGMARYVPFDSVDTARLAWGMAALGLVLAALNVVVVFIASEQVWLIYTTFLDIPVAVIGVWIVTIYAVRGNADGEAG